MNQPTPAQAGPPVPAPRSEPGSPVIVATGLTRTYGSGRDAFTAVDGIDLEVRPGELFALLGTNGAGKTSTLEVLEGMAPPSSGAVRVLGGDPWTARSAIRPRQGLMLQTGGFPADLTAAEALRMWCSTLTSPRPVEELLGDVDLIDRGRTRISSLSGGEVRRLDLACAIAGDPDLLFLDEPTTGLDPESRARAWALVRRLKERGTTIVLTTHYLDEAGALADRIAIMHRGRIVRTGTPTEIVAGHPSSIRCELPDGAPPLPALRGTARLDGERLEISTDALQDDLDALLRWAHSHELALDSLDARAASLESVFLSIAEGEQS